MDEKKVILGKITVKEKVQFVLDREHSTLLDELCLAIKREIGYKPDRSEILRILLDLLRDERPISKKILYEHVLDLKLAKEKERLKKKKTKKIS